MINLYAYTYPSAIKLFEDYVLTKVGESISDVEESMKEQGGEDE